MNITPLKYILLIENVLCVFRNYTSFKSCGRKVIIIWIFLEITNLTLNIVTFAQYRAIYPLTINSIYMLSVTSFSIGLLLASIYHARRFNRLLSNFKSYTVFQDSLYSHNLRRIQKKSTIIITVFLFYKMLKLFYFNIIPYFKSRDRHLFLVIFNQFNASVGNIRYIIEFLLLHCILYVMSEQLDAISRSIDSEMSIHGDEKEVITVYRDEVKCFDKWMQAYRNIKESSDLCCAIFRVQLSIMLLIVTMYYIMLIYSTARNCIVGLLTPTIIAANTLAMVVFLSVLFLISKAGQKVHNSSVALRLKLCQLYIHAIQSKNLSRSTKDLLRFTSTRPIRICVFGTLDVNMSLVPSCVGFFTSYTVIALQMNNIL